LRCAGWAKEAVVTEQADGGVRVAADLLTFARAHLGHPGLSYAEPPRRLSGGRDTEVYALRFSGLEGDLAGPLVLRLFPAGDDRVARHRVRFEAAVHRAVIEQGYPAPAVLLEGAEAQIDGRRFLVMARVPGRNMDQWVFTRTGLRLGVHLAEIHVALHAIDAPAVLETVRAHLPGLAAGADDGVSAGLRGWEERLGERGVTDLDPVFAWLAEHRPEAGGVAVCHGDLHPLNVLMNDGRVSGVIDWADARIGDPAYDVARTSVLMRHGPLQHSALRRLAINVVRHSLERQYRRTYLRARPIAPDRLAYYEVLNAATMLAQAAIARLDGRDYAWRDPGAARRLARLIAARTGGVGSVHVEATI
jgi:aminoglycoside phosphotransferase (APT) family kinase protein